MQEYTKVRVYTLSDVSVDYQTLWEQAMHYGPVTIDLEGTELTTQEKALLNHPALGGVVLSTRNLRDKASLITLTQAIRSEARNSILIFIQNEAEQRWFFDESFAHFSTAKHYGEVYRKNPQEALTLAQNAGRMMAVELLACGIDLSLSPILDPDKHLNDLNEEQGFMELVGTFMQGIKSAGMAALARYFPTQKAAEAPQSLFAVDDRLLDMLLTNDFLQLTKLSDSLEAIVPAEVIYSKIDTVPPAYSRQWLQEILRKQLNFQGAIIADNLFREGLAVGDLVIKTHMALDAGCDMVMLCHPNRNLIETILDRLERTTSKDSNQRLRYLAGNSMINLKN